MYLFILFIFFFFQIERKKEQNPNKSQTYGLQAASPSELEWPAGRPSAE